MFSSLFKFPAIVMAYLFLALMLVPRNGRGFVVLARLRLRCYGLVQAPKRP